MSYTLDLPPAGAGTRSVVVPGQGRRSGTPVRTPR